MGRKRTPEEEARRELIRELLSKANVTGMEDSLDAELEETLGYGKYDHTARTESGTTNSRNGHSKKTLKTSAGKIDINIPRDRKGEFEPRILPKNQTSVSAEIEGKIISIDLGYRISHQGYLRHGHLGHNSQPDNRQSASRSAGMAAETA